MRKVLIVDDEYIGREMLRESVCWEDYGFTVVGEACNGIEALKKVRELKPDVLFTDIRMPGIDGLELILQLKKNHETVKCVAISSYEDFSYVRSAFREGVVDYLTKHTFQTEDIARVLENLNTLFNSERQHLLEKDAIRRQQDLSMLFGNGQAAKFPLKWNRSKSTTYVVLAVSVESEQYLMELYRQMESNPGNSKLLLTAPKGRNVYCVYQMRTPKFRVELKETIKVIHVNSYEVLGRECFIGMSAPFSDPSSMHAAYLQAREASNYSIYCAHQKYVEYREIAGGYAHIRNFQKMLDLNYFRILIRTEQGAISAKAEAIEIFRNNVCCNPHNENILRSYQELLIQIRSLGCKENQDIDKQVQRCYEKLQKNIQFAVSLAQLENNIAELFDCVIAFLKQAQEYSPYIAMAVKYIDENLSHQLSLDLVADAIGLSRTYLSQLFHREMRITYSQYVLQRRIDMARWMLRNTNKKVYEISRLVGFNEVHHFSFKFKEMTGMSPNDYRKATASSINF